MNSSQLTAPIQRHRKCINQCERLACPPEEKTMKWFTKTLCNVGEITEIAPNFTDQRGFVSDSVILAKTELELTDLMLRQLQEKVVEAHPDTCTLPEEEVAGRRIVQVIFGKTDEQSRRRRTESSVGGEGKPDVH